MSESSDRRTTSSGTSSPTAADPDGFAAPAAINRVASTRPAVRDSDFPTLQAVLDSVELGKQISLLPASQWSWGIPQEVRIEVLKRDGAMNCTLEIAVRTESGWHPLIGKVYANDKRGLRAHDATEGLWRAGFGRDAEASIPQPIAYLPSLRLLLQEKVEGLEAKEIFKYGDEPLRALAAERCARWLARFHSLNLPSDRVLRVEKILARCQRAHRRISGEDGRLAAKSERLYRELEAAALRVEAKPLRPGHGDFGFHNIYLAGRQTITFDWDLHDAADPARDVARFIVMLARLALHRLGSIRELDGAAEVFLAAYLSAGGARVTESLPFYEGELYLRGAESDLETRGRQWRQWTEAMLDEGLRTLEHPVKSEEAGEDV